MFLFNGCNKSEVLEFMNKTDYLWVSFFHILGFKKYVIVNFTHLLYIRDFCGIPLLFLIFKNSVLMVFKNSLKYTIIC